MASDVFNIVDTKHLPAFRQICGLFFRCAMSNLAYGRTLSYPKIKLLTAIRCIKPLPYSFSFSLQAFLRGRLYH